MAMVARPVSVSSRVRTRAAVARAVPKLGVTSDAPA